jgi:nucleoid-associated protein YgaU
VGKLEKVVVLTVLFLVALILGVSLNSPDGVAEPKPTLAAEQGPVAGATGAPVAFDVPGASGERQRTSPVSPRRAKTAGAPAAAGSSGDANAPAGAPHVPAGAPAQDPIALDSNALAQAGTASAPSAGPAGALSTSRPPVGAALGASAPAPGAAADGAVRTTVGLVPSLSEEFMIYTWQEGDTFAAVAERYFGSRLHVNRLLANNEGLEDRRLRAGDEILIPVRFQEPGTGVPAASGATTYTVKAGDVLGTISMTVYGTSKSWRKIYDANRDLLADPNRLEVGMVLRIPE